MLRIEVKSTALKLREGVSGKGKAYAFNQQEAWIDMPNGERRKLTLTLDTKAQPYAPGTYELAPESFGVDQFGTLELSRVHLVAAKAVRAA